MRRCSLLLLVGSLAASLASCSNENPATPQPDSPASAVTPRIAAPEFDRVASGSGEEALTADVAAGGIPTTYQAYFADGRLARISETRRNAAGETARGDYEFHGARLIEYSGQSLHGGSTLDLQFDLNGRVTLARAGAQEASAAEISEVRNRAQLLRSHALATHATRKH